MRKVFVIGCWILFLSIFVSMYASYKGEKQVVSRCSSTMKVLKTVCKVFRQSVFLAYFSAKCGWLLIDEFHKAPAMEVLSGVGLKEGELPALPGLYIFFMSLLNRVPKSTEDDMFEPTEEMITELNKMLLDITEQEIAQLKKAIESQ
jgi:hypothetical protein